MVKILVTHLKALCANCCSCSFFFSFGCWTADAARLSLFYLSSLLLSNKGAFLEETMNFMLLFIHWYLVLEWLNYHEVISFLLCSSVQVLSFGSVPLKTYLPDGDIDLTAFSFQNLVEDLAKEVCRILKCEEDSEFQVKDVQYVHAQVWLSLLWSFLNLTLYFAVFSNNFIYLFWKALFYFLFFRWELHKTNLTYWYAS